MKTFKKVTAVLVLGAMVFSMAGCKKIEAVDADDFIDAICDEFDIDEDDIIDWDEDDYEDIFWYDDDTETMVDLMIYEDADDAMDEFEEWKDEITGDQFSGSQRNVTLSGNAYVVFDGKVTESGEKSNIYGGVYVVDENLYVIYTTSKSDKDVIDNLLDAYNFPKP